MLSDLDRIELVELAEWFERSALDASDEAQWIACGDARYRAQLIRRVIAELWPPAVAGRDTHAAQFRATVPPPPANSPGIVEQMTNDGSIGTGPFHDRDGKARL